MCKLRLRKLGLISDEELKENIIMSFNQFCINESKDDSKFTEEELELIKKYSNFTDEWSYLEFEHDEETGEYETISKWIDGNTPRYTICVYRQDDYSGDGYMTVEYSHKIESKKNQTLEDFLNIKNK